MLRSNTGALECFCTSDLGQLCLSNAATYATAASSREPFVWAEYPLCRDLKCGQDVYMVYTMSAIPKPGHISALSAESNVKCMKVYCPRTPFCCVCLREFTMHLQHAGSASKAARTRGNASSCTHYVYTHICGERDREPEGCIDRWMDG